MIKQILEEIKASKTETATELRKKFKEMIKYLKKHFDLEKDDDTDERLVYRDENKEPILFRIVDGGYIFISVSKYLDPKLIKKIKLYMDKIMPSPFAEYPSPSSSSSFFYSYKNLELLWLKKYLKKY